MMFFLTGSSGQLGTEWYNYLKSNGYEVTAYSSSQLDITHHDEVESKLKASEPDVVINCAAYTKVDDAEEKKVTARRINTLAVANLARCCHQTGAKLIHYSTDYIFPGYPADRKLFPDGYPENQPAEPLNEYGKTKWEGEIALKENLDNYLILRVAWLCGQYGQNFVTKILQLSEKRPRLKVVNDQWGSPTFTQNVVENSMILLNNDLKGTFHINSRGIINWHQFAAKICALTGQEVDIIPVSSSEFTSRAARPYFSKLNTRKLQEVSGSRIIDWQEGLQKLIAQLS